MKRLALKLALSLTIVLAFTAQAQQGQWTIHPVYLNNEFQEIVDLGAHVYYLQNGSLYKFDKTSHDIQVLDMNNELSDLTITGMYFNSVKNYIVLVYDNSNMDFLYADGTIRNFRQLHETVFSWSKAVNDITFDGDRLYVATDFGYVVIDDTRMQVVEEYNFETQFTSVARVGEARLIVRGDKIYCDTTANHDMLTDFVDMNLAAAKGRLFPVSDNAVIVTTMAQAGIDKGRYKTATTMRTVTLSVSADTIIATSGTTISTTGTAAANKLRGYRLQATPTGYLANFPEGGKHYAIDPTGTTYTAISGNTNETFSCSPLGDGTTWAVGINGIHIKGDATYYSLDGTLGIQGVPYFLAYNSMQDKVYLTCTPSIGTGDVRQPGIEIYTFDGSQWLNETPSNISSGMTYELTFNTNDPNIYYAAKPTGNTRVIKNGQQMLELSNTIAPTTNRRSRQVFDSEGNLWIYISTNRTSTHLMMQPASINVNATSELGDWKTFALAKSSSQGFKMAQMAISTSDVIAVSGCYYGEPLVLFRNVGTTDAPVEKSLDYNSFHDQTGNTFTFTQISTLMGDKQGRIWVGTTNGLVVIDDPVAALNAGYTATRPKIKATGEYLCDNLQINGFACDDLGRIWIATNSAGLWLVNANGTEVLGNWTPDNSNIPSASVYQVCVTGDPDQIFVTTSSGVAQLSLDVTQQQLVDNYDHALAFPNPVMPSFNGFVTINGLIAGSAVRITDRDGNEIATLTASGESVAWDACDENGYRLPTGVYIVYAAPTAAQLATAQEVTRVSIINR